MERKESRLMGDILMNIIRERGLDKGILFSDVCEAYDNIVGPVFSKATTNKSLQKGVFICKINSSVKRTQLAMNAETIKQRINEQLGQSAIKEIMFS